MSSLEKEIVGLAKDIADLNETVKAFNDSLDGVRNSLQRLLDSARGAAIEAANPAAPKEDPEDPPFDDPSAGVDTTTKTYTMDDAARVVSEALHTKGPDVVRATLTSFKVTRVRELKQDEIANFIHALEAA